MSLVGDSFEAKFLLTGLTVTPRQAAAEVFVGITNAIAATTSFRNKTPSKPGQRESLVALHLTWVKGFFKLWHCSSFQKQRDFENLLGCGLCS